MHPSSAALPSPTSPNFRLSPTVYTPPSRQSPPIPPTAPLRSSARASTQSTMTRATHDSRSWLPDDGLYLAEEGDEYAEYKTYHRPSEDSRPTSYLSYTSHLILEDEEPTIISNTEPWAVAHLLYFYSCRPCAAGHYFH